MTDDPFPAAEIGFHQGTPVVPRRFLPTHAAMFGNRLQMPVTRSGRRLGSLARHRIRTRWHDDRDRKSTRLNSSHPSISYAVFCLKKKNKTNKRYRRLSLTLTQCLKN